MKKIRDHYFAAWLIVYKNLEYSVKDKIIYFDISHSELLEFQEEYQNVKPFLKKIRNLVKIFNN